MILSGSPNATVRPVDHGTTAMLLEKPLDPVYLLWYFGIRTGKYHIAKNPSEIKHFQAY